MDRQTAGLERYTFSARNLLCGQNAGVAENGLFVKGQDKRLAPPLTTTPFPAIIAIKRSVIRPPEKLIFSHLLHHFLLFTQNTELSLTPILSKFMLKHTHLVKL